MVSVLFAVLLCLTGGLLIAEVDGLHDIQLRLVGGGYNSCQGRVEVYYDGQWGTVCDDNWGMEDAEVVCRQQGCGEALQSKVKAHFGQGSGQIWMDDVACTGEELSLKDCGHAGFGTHNCNHREDAGVVCTEPCRRHCPLGWTKHNCRCFKYFNSGKTWQDAELYCITVGGNLASVHSIQENNVIRGLTGQQRPTLWIGGYDVNSDIKIRTWLQSDGSRFDFTKWNANEPNNYKNKHERCVEMWPQGTWNDGKCHAKMYFVCARNA